MHPSSTPHQSDRSSRNRSPPPTSTLHPYYGATSSGIVDSHEDLNNLAPTAILSSSVSSHHSLIGSYRQPSFAFGGGPSRPAFAPGSAVPTSIDALPPPEKLRMERDQIALLKDNHIPTTDPLSRTRSRRLSTNSRISDVLNLLDPAPLDDEETALLGHTETDRQWENAILSDAIHTSYWRETKTILSSSAPLYITFVLQYSLTLCSIFSAGNLGKDELAGVSLASMTAAITGYAPVQGLTTALDTLCAQAYGSGNRKLVGLHLQRMVAFLGLVMVPVMGFWWFSEGVLGAVLKEKELARWAGLYLRILAVGLPGFAIFEASKRFVQAQGLFTATTWVLCICSPVNAFLNWFLVWHPTYGLGFIGAPIAVVLTDYLMPFLLFLYVYFIRGRDCWPGLSPRALTNWAPMIRLAVPGFIMIEAEYAAFEILILIASTFSTAHVAAQSVLGTISALMFQLPFAFSIATSTRVANFLGAGLVEGAQVATRTGLALACVVGLVDAAVMWLIRKPFVNSFTDDLEVRVLFLSAIGVGCAFQFVDAVGVCTAGILRGQGRQRLGSYVNLIAYYAIGIPVSVILAFGYKMELVGLWSGMGVALTVVAGVECGFLWGTDWEGVVEDARKRNEADAEAEAGGKGKRVGECEGDGDVGIVV